MGLSKQPKTIYFYRITCEQCSTEAGSKESVSPNGAVRVAVTQAGFVADLDGDDKLIWFCKECAEKRAKQ